MPARTIDTLPVPVRVKPKKLIVLSAPRTGTHGLYLALKQLGYAPYHMEEVVKGGIQSLAILTEGMKASFLHEGKPYGREEFDKWFANYDVIIEMPFFMLPQIVDAYPDAKFLLTERDPERWADSLLNTVGLAQTRINSFPMTLFKYFDAWMMRMDGFGGGMLRYCTNGFGVSGEGREMLVRNYREYIAEVKRLVPPEQLKVCKLEDGFGWEEICPYLGVPIPDTPWPSLNKPEEFHSIVKPQIERAFRKGIVGVTTMVAVAAAGLWYVRKSLSAR
ncbi:P-loop containing nucleoside triphosphate hydrolase protein [Xylariaceae sp. FL0594]|nr:P-loop containing nucleoside triphosphate hydrolase protein [Xylariaceae sp. FL0594]